MGNRNWANCKPMHLNLLDKGFKSIILNMFKELKKRSKELRESMRKMPQQIESVRSRKLKLILHLHLSHPPSLLYTPCCSCTA